MVTLSHVVRQQPQRRRRFTKTNVSLLSAVVVLGLIYYRVSMYLLRDPDGTDNGPRTQKRRLNDDKIQLQDLQYIHELQHQGLLVPSKALRTYQEWKEYAVQLAALAPDKIIETLKTIDPFGVRSFEKELLEAESQKQAFLTQDELRAIFPCPSSSSSSSSASSPEQRITLPDQRNSDKARAFRNGTDPFFLFFQHLRKAGGTNFCSLAQHNLPKKQVPKYFCSTSIAKGKCVCHAVQNLRLSLL